MSTFQRVTQFVFPASKGSKGATEGGENTLPQKTVFASQPTKRAALGDIGNKNGTAGHAGKKFAGTKSRQARKLPAREPIHAYKHTSISVRKATSVHDVLREESEFMDTQEDPALTGRSSDLKTPPRLFVAPLPAGVEDADEDDIGNPQQVTEYVGEIYAYMKQLERRHAVGEDHLAIQANVVTPEMRAILVDWLHQVHDRFKLLNETMYVTMDILDRFLALQPIARSKMQLVGITAMLIGCKYEEMYPPDVGDFEYMTDGAYSRAEILAMEGLILKTLDFNLGTPLPLHFLRRLSKVSGADAHIHAVAKYLMALRTVDYEMTRFLPSEVACAALWISRKMLCGGETPWNASLEHYSTYGEAEVLPCVSELHRVLAHSVDPRNEQVAVIRKYSTKKAMHVSRLPLLKAYIANLQ